jgi:hypothetical protein
MPRNSRTDSQKVTDAPARPAPRTPIPSQAVQEIGAFHFEISRAAIGEFLHALRSSVEADETLTSLEKNELLGVTRKDLFATATPATAADPAPNTRIPARVSQSPRNATRPPISPPWGDAGGAPPALAFAGRSVFLGMETVRAKFGCDAEKVLAMVEKGKLRWVFDISVDGTARNLRFWTGEIVAPQIAARQTEQQVIAAILGYSAAIRRGQIERQWICSAQHVMRLVRAGELSLAGPKHITRTSLAAFLKRRLQ